MESSKIDSSKSIKTELLQPKKNVNQDKINNRKLEKEFFREIIEICIYLVLFIVIISFGYEHSYIDMRINSNEYIRSEILAKTNWNNVIIN